MLPHGPVHLDASRCSACVVVAGKNLGLDPLNSREPVGMANGGGGLEKLTGPVSVAVTTIPLGSIVPVATLPDMVHLAGYCGPAAAASAGPADTAPRVTAPSAVAAR